MLIEEHEINFIVTSNYDDEGYDCELWYKKTCLIVVSINDEEIIEITFSKLHDFSFKYNVLLELLEKACSIVRKKYNDFKAGDINL